MNGLRIGKVSSYPHKPRTAASPGLRGRDHLTCMKSAIWLQKNESDRPDRIHCLNLEHSRAFNYT
uniref:Uncharacterized protein n=2 Tax=Picea TaxID=3328 RepID=A0A117NG91_PICGL|nr:hypothetical protein ABT39_MTgene1487 [Picea glauca]QHR92665.1 hypothetical protein Q903MT_gene6713 [Picea sitchensis]